MASYDDLAGRLDGIADELADAGIAELRDAVERGESSRPASERVLARAERSVRKAAALLRDLGDG